MSLKQTRKIGSSSLRSPKHPESELITAREAQLLTNSRELSIIGLRQCLDSSRSGWNRLIWGVLVACGFMVSVYQINDRFLYYFSYTTSSEVDVVTVRTLDFPQVTICSENFIKRSAAREKDLEAYFKTFFPPYVLPGNASNFRKAKPLNISQEELLELERFLSPGEEQLLVCFWQNQECPKEMAELIFTNYGRCLTFNLNKFGFEATSAGTSSGLTLVLNANHSDYFVQFGSSVGYMILLHEPNEPPRIKELGGKIGVGQSVSVAISTTRVYRLKSPYGSCSDEPSYHPVKCRLDCQRKTVNEKCGCRAIYMPGDGKVCDYYTEWTCVNPILDDFYSRSDNADLCVCAPLCHEINYRATISRSGFSRNFINEMDKDIISSTYEEINDNVVHMQIFMSEMQYTKISAVAGYSFMALLSDIGGALGLFLGSTILTYFEVLDLLWQLVALCWVASKKRKLPKVARMF